MLDRARPPSPAARRGAARLWNANGSGSSIEGLRIYRQALRRGAVEAALVQIITDYVQR
jgi:hypothetical protein